MYIVIGWGSQMELWSAERLAGSVINGGNEIVYNRWKKHIFLTARHESTYAVFQWLKSMHLKDWL